LIFVPLSFHPQGQANAHASGAGRGAATSRPGTDQDFPSPLSANSAISGLLPTYCDITYCEDDFNPWNSKLNVAVKKYPAYEPGALVMADVPSTSRQSQE
jgi:hypothetical protein